MGKPNFSKGFKRDAVYAIAVRGYPFNSSVMSYHWGGAKVGQLLARLGTWRV